MNRRGFTLTELLVVIAIMAVLAMISIPMVGPMFRDRALDSSVSKVQGVIMKARSLAAINRSVYYISFNTLPDAAGKRTQDFMIVYSSQYDNAGVMTPILTTEWDSFWNGTKTGISTPAEGRKKLVANPPVYLEKDTRLGLTSGACGNDSYLGIHPDGEIEFKGNFNLTSGDGRNEARSPAMLNLGVLKLVVRDKEAVSGDPIGASEIKSEIGLILLTSEFYTID